MTLPTERTRAVIELANAVVALGPYAHGKSEMVRVPRATLRHLLRLLRHYPRAYDMELTAEWFPDLWAMDNVGAKLETTAPAQE